MSQILLNATPTTLRNCTNCHRPPQDGQKLRRCSGCVQFDRASYCSKQCQREHWPSHKLYCRPGQPITPAPGVNRPRAFGYTSYDALNKDAHDFVQAHTWAFGTAAKVVAYLKYGPAYLEHPPTQLLHCRLKCNSTRDRRERDPARTFSFEDLRFDDIQNLAVETADWDTARKTQYVLDKRKDALEHFKRIPWPSNTPLVGVLLVAIGADGSNAVAIQAFPQFTPEESPLLDLLRSGIADATPMFDDLILLCKQSIGSSFPFHRPADSRVAYPGRYVHTRGQWTWEPLFTDWDDYLNGRVECPRLPALEGLRSGYTPPELMTMTFVI